MTAGCKDHMLITQCVKLIFLLREQTSTELAAGKEVDNNESDNYCGMSHCEHVAK